MEAKSRKGILETTGILERNIQALIDRKNDLNKKRTLKDRIVDFIADFASSMYSVYFHLIIYGSWIAWNAQVFGNKMSTPHYIDIATFAAVEAIILSTFVLIGQRRTNLQNEKWAELDLQVSLLAEHELTKAIGLIKAIAEKLNISVEDDEEIEELTKEIHPEKVLDSIEKAVK